MRGTVAKRLRKTRIDFVNPSYACKLFIKHYRELGFDDVSIQRKHYKRSKASYKYWRRYPEYMGSFF